jgi:hypothetical protein
VVGVCAADGVATSAYGIVKQSVIASDLHVFDSGDDNRIRMSIEETFGHDDGRRRGQALLGGASIILSEAACSLS